MNKAFIFDMDGVIVDSESLWLRYEKQFLPELFGEEIYAKMIDQILGNTISKIYEIACGYGCTMEKEKFVEIYDSYAKIVYKKANITPGIEALIDKLIAMNFRLALVSSSRQPYIDIVLARIPKVRKKFQYILSLNDAGMETKPSPEGYRKAMKILNATPNSTIILEDSERGVTAAKASGAFTICLKENIPNDNLIPQGADLYVENVKDLIEQIKTINI